MSYSAKRYKRMLAGVLAAAMALTVTPILGFTGTAGAAHYATADPIGVGNVCEGAPEQDDFTDIGDDDPAVDEVRCMVHATPAITQGVTATTYEPNSFVQRRQMALFLQRVADLAEAHETSEDAVQALPEDDGESAFTDIGDESADHQQAIRRLEDSGITQGVTATEFRPGDNVTRRQMAKFLVRLQTFLAGEDFVFPIVNDCEDCFNDDDGDSGEAELNILAREGVFIGTGGEGDVHNVSPGDEITRRQMAFVLTRKLEVLFEAGLINRLFLEAFVECENESFSDGAPELLRVRELEDDVLTFTFDETITGQALKFTGMEPNREYWGFRLYDPDGAVAYPTEARIEGDMVIARFPASNTPNVATASLATVRYDAVEDVTGIPSIEGECALLPPTTIPQGTNPFAPQLIAVDNYRTADVIVGGTQEILIDYTFNAEGAHLALGLEDGGLVDGNDFYLVGQFGGEFQADIIDNVDSSGGQTVITVAFSEDPTEVPESQLRRGYVVADGTDPDGDNVEAEGDGDGLLGSDDAPDSDGNGIVLSEPFEGGDDITDVPDLESVVRTGDTTYRFEFDEAVSDTELDASRFFVFDSDGNETSALEVARSAVAADEARVVIATFPVLPDEGAGTPVDAFVADGAVRATDSTDEENGGFNRPDEVVLTLPAGPETEQPPAGITAKPDLLSISRDQNIVTENFSVTYEFDQTITPAQVEGTNFDLYDDNGVQFRIDATCGMLGVTCSGASVTFSIDAGFGGFSNEQIAAAVTGGVESDTLEADQAELTGEIDVTEAQTGITDV